MDRVRLGVVFINYCRSDLLFEALNSLETVHVLKLFIVDRAKLKSETPSLAAGWNRGIEAALAWGAEWVLVASDDVLFHPCTVDHLVQRARERSYEFLCPYDVATRLGLTEADLASLAAPEEGRDEQAADYSCFLLTPELFREVGPFDERFVPAYFEDADYNLRLGLCGKTGMLTSYAPFIHHGGASGDLPPEAKGRNRDYFVAKWKDVVPWAEAFAGSESRGRPERPHDLDLTRQTEDGQQTHPVQEVTRPRGGGVLLARQPPPRDGDGGQPVLVSEELADLLHHVGGIVKEDGALPVHEVVRDHDGKPLAKE